MALYLYTDYTAAIRGRLHNTQALLADERVTANNAVNEVAGDLDLRSTKRKAALAPNLFNEEYQYACPTDIKGKKLIGLQPQILERDRHNRWSLVPEEDFDILKQTRYNLLSVSDRDLTRKLLVSVNVSDKSLTVSSLDALTGAGSWALFGDATNLTADSFNYIKGNGSIQYDISGAGGTTAGIQAIDIPAYDLTNYYSNGSAFAWAYLTSATNVTNFKLRLGNNASNYYEMTATTANDGTAFVAGWNLLRFDFSGKATTGSPVNASCAYAVIYMTKAGAKVNETSYRFDHIILKLGKIYNAVYYSKYLWQNASGTWIIKSTADTDYLNVDVEEFNILVEKGAEWYGNSIVGYKDEAIIAHNNYERMKKEYRRNYKSEALSETTDYYYFNS